MKHAEPLGLITFLTCEMVVHDYFASRYSPINVFTSLSARSFPAVFQNFWLFVEMNAGKDWNAVTYRVATDDPAEPPVYERQWITAITDPVGITTDHVTLGPLTFPRPGIYYVDLLHEGDTIVSRRIMVELEVPLDLTSLDTEDSVGDEP